MAEDTRKLAVIAFGGNAVDPTGESAPGEMWEHVWNVCGYIIALIKERYRVVLTHGNGPQVGRLLIRMEKTKDTFPPMSMDICVSDTQAEIGYMIQQCMMARAEEANRPFTAVTVVTQVEVDRNDPAFQNPTKPIGPFYSEREARVLESENGWLFVQDSNRGYRRIVPSPKPIKIIEEDAIRSLLKDRHVVVAVGGGGIPVVREGQRYVGVDAVIDKDYASALLANDLQADVFIILTGVEQVALDFGKPGQRPLPSMTMAEARAYMAEGQFPKGSMGPKVDAGLLFLERGGEEVLITSMEALPRAIRGETGTRMLRD